MACRQSQAGQSQGGLSQGGQSQTGHDDGLFADGTDLSACKCHGLTSSGKGAVGHVQPVGLLFADNTMPLGEGLSQVVQVIRPALDHEGQRCLLGHLEAQLIGDCQRLQ